jgi:hypothetical protein
VRIELASIGPDGNPNWIDVRDKIKGGDIFAVHEASEVPIDDGGRTTSISFEGLQDAQFAALAQRVITAWSFPGVPLPTSAVAARSVISDLEEDDFWKLNAALKPMLDKIKNGGQADPKPPATS